MIEAADLLSTVALAPDVRATLQEDTMNTTATPGHRFTDRAASLARIQALAALPADPWDTEPVLTETMAANVVRILGSQTTPTT